jgi:hypothetical protein
MHKVNHLNDGTLCIFPLTDLLFYGEHTTYRLDLSKSRFGWKIINILMVKNHDRVNSKKPSSALHSSNKYRYVALY